MAGEQLERSILERKERDELHAIASAMSLKPASRSRKADIIDLILTATGVPVGEGDGQNGNGHASGNGSSAPTDAHGAETDGASAALAADDVVTAPANGAEAPGDAAAGGESPATGRPRRSPRTASRRAAPVEDGGADEGTGAPRAATLPDTVSEPAGAAEGSSAQAAARRAAEAEAEAAGGADATTGDAGREATAEAGPAAPPVRGEPAETRPQGGARGDGQPRGQQREPRAPHAAASGGPGQGNGATDAGNRRGRRRRGRERERGGEIQGGQESTWQGELVPVKGLLDLREEGYGFLRTSGYLASNRDVYVSVSQARKFALRKGDAIEGACRPAGPSEKYPALLRIDSVGGLVPDEARQRRRFEDLTPLFPDETLHLEQTGEPANLTARIVDLISPIGKGQRGMIVSPPKAGKTTIMKQIAHSIEANNPGVHLIVLLVDERPEEVTDMRRSVRGEVIASTFDRPADEHTAVAELTIERAKRLVELGRDVVIILDGITRLARAYNLAQPATGRIMSGGVDSGALYPPKRFFGAARNIEEGGSLTILATALVETGSKMDEVIFEEFKGTGNMELRLDRKLAERRLYPAIDVNASSTRHEELLFDRSQLQQVWKLRRVLNALSNEGSGAAGLELLIDKIRTTRSNDEFLAEIAKAPVGSA
ncbi:MAG TPA: transcription termination factor Rho [Acidimicrobiales bacterium]|nr:transcription termination factor Rho [Acidimicrobiales bacterium]